MDPREKARGSEYDCTTAVLFFLSPVREEETPNTEMRYLHLSILSSKLSLPPFLPPSLPPSLPPPPSSLLVLPEEVAKKLLNSLQVFFCLHSTLDNRLH